MANPNLVREGTPCQVCGRTLRYKAQGNCVWCGHVRNTRNSKRHIEMHGLRHLPEYHEWADMMQRCYNPHRKDFRYYGGRGITVCDRWRKSFSAFLADMGRRPTPQHSPDRWPNQHGNYEPGNCRWATRTEQMRNSRQAKITLADAQLIRQLYVKGTNHLNRGNCAELATRFGITKVMICNIVRGRFWKE